MPSRIRYGLLISLIVISLFVIWFSNSYAGSINYIYDELGRLYQVFDPQGNVTTYNYDAAGNRLSLTHSTGAPVVTGISPNSARARDTIGVTISGNYLLIDTAVSTDNPGISVSNVKLTQNSITATFSISWLARQGLTTVTVSNVFGSAQIAFTVTPPVPIIDALSPASGPVARLVEINGTAFSDIPSGNVVRFNGVIAPVYSCTRTQILCSVPSGTTSGPVTVTTNSGTSNGVNFTVTSAGGPPPTINSINPNVGSVEGGGHVTIYGSGFTSDTQVFINQKAVAGVTVDNASTLSIITAPGVAGICDVFVTNINGGAFLPGGFTYLSATSQWIVRVNPPAGLANVPINTPIAALFAKPVDRTTINSASFSLVESNTSTPVQGTFSFDFDDKTVIFVAQSSLKPNTDYTLSIATSIKSADGIPLDQAFTGSFATGGLADVVSPTVTVSPIDQSTGIPINGMVVFIFSEPMNPPSLNSSTILVTNNGMPVSGNITLNRINTSAIFVPFSNFLPNSLVNVTLSYKVTDMAGNPVVGSSGVGTDFVSSFTTGSTIDIDPPQVASINPADGTVGINGNTTVSVTFNEPINPVTVNSETFTLSVSGLRQSGRISFSGENTIVTFVPDQTLPPLSLVTVALLPGISDMAGNPITSTFTSSFTTGEPRLVIGYPGPTTLTLGDTINIEVTNTGDLDTSCTYTVKLSDKNEVIIYQNTIFDTIQAGASKTYSFQIPNQAADSDYTLYAEVIDSRNIKTTNSFGIKIIGLNAALSTRTDKDIYLPTESITGISNILNGQFGIEDGSLKVAVSKTSQSTTGQFTHFLPKTGWWFFNGPSGVAVGSDGSMYVADTYNSRIQKFDSSGNFIMRWGDYCRMDSDWDSVPDQSCEAGQFAEPYGIAIGPDGSVYVTDTGNNRIQKFGSGGNFITMWGSYGSGNGQFNGPKGIAVGPDGSVYVADTGNNRIQKFGSNGNFIAKWWGFVELGFNAPSGIAVGSDGSVYVADTGRHYIEKLDSDGNFITWWGGWGTGNGKFKAPSGIAVGLDGFVYVTDADYMTFNHRIQKFDSNGNFITKWGSIGVGDGEFYFPYGIAIGSDNSVFVADTWNNRIQKFDSNGNFIMKWGVVGRGDGEFASPEGIAVGSDKSIYVADGDRIQKFDGSGNFITKWGSYCWIDPNQDGVPDISCEGGQFAGVSGIAIGPDGSLYVTDPYNYRIQKFDSSGNFITKWGSFCQIDPNWDGVPENSCDGGQFAEPSGIAIGPDGSVYVADTYNHRIQKFDGSGNFIAKWGYKGSGDGQFDSPIGVAVSPDGSVYVADTYNNRIQKFDSDGNFITKWGGVEGSGDGEFSYPAGITVSPDGSVYVADTGNWRIQKFDSNGNFIKKWESTYNTNNGDGEFYNLVGIAVTVDGSVLVVDSELSRIQKMVETLFETILPINQPASTTQDYTTNIGSLNITGQFYLQATLMNSLGQTITQANYPFYISIDTTPPTGTITINSGAAFTNSSNVTLTLSCSDSQGCSQMQFSNDNVTYSTAEAYATSKAWTLTSGDGTKTVYAKFKDTPGNWSLTYSNTILLDATLSTTSASPTGGTYNSAQSVTLSCSDGTGSGCDKIYYTTDGTTPTASSPIYSSPINIPVTTTLKFFARDLAGNSETVKTELYTISTNMVTVELKNSIGDPLSGGVVQYYSGGWQVFGTTDASGRVSKELQPGNYTFSMSYAFARQEKSQNTAINPTVVFQTTRVTIELRDSANSLMDTGTVQYYSGGWRDIGSTSGGQVTKELLPGSYTFSMTYAFARQEKSQNIATNPTVVFQTTRVMVELRDSVNSLMDTGTVQYYSGGWRDIGITSGGQVTKELLPGSYTFSMTYAYARNEKSQNIGTNPTVAFQTTNVTVQLKDSTGSLMDTGTVQYYSGGWRDIGTTSGGQVSKELLPGSYTFSMAHAFARQEKSQNIATNPTVVFQTTKVTVELRDSTNSLIDIGTVQYYSGGWRDIGTTSGGQVSKELLPGSYTFSMTYGFARQEKSQNVAANPTVVFQTTKVTVQLKDSTGALMDTGTVQYYSGGWRDIGNTSGGQVTKELLPGSYTFSMTYGFARQEKSQNIATNPTVVFQTGQVHSDSGACTQYYAGGWRTFVQDMELLPSTYTFRFNDGIPDTSYTITSGTGNHIH